jgi:hypothetical protein
VQNDHFDPHGFAAGGIIASGALAVSMVSAMRSAACEIEEIVEERSEAERLATLNQMFADQAQRFAEMRAIIAAQNAVIENMATIAHELSARLLAYGDTI